MKSHLKISLVGTHDCLYMILELFSVDRSYKLLPVYYEGPLSPLSPIPASTGRELFQALDKW